MYENVLISGPNKLNGRFLIVNPNCIMNNYIYILISLLACSACTKPKAEQTPMGDLTISIDVVQVAVGETFSSLYVSMHNSDSSVVLVLEPLSIYLTDNGYISETIHLPLDKYTLDGVVLQNHRGESTYFAPKNGSKAAFACGKSMPETFNFSDSNIQIDIPAVNPRIMGIKPADCGYEDFPNWNIPVTPNSPNYGARCVKIGVGYGRTLTKPLEFNFFADDSIVLTGTCSGGVTDFPVPGASKGYRITVKVHGNVFDQSISLTEFAKYSCSGSKFIDLRSLISNKPEIVFIRQEVEMGKPLVKLSLMDTDGNIYKKLSPVALNDSLGKAVFIIDSITYSTYQSYMVTPVAVCSTDSIAKFQGQLPKIESELNTYYTPNGMPSPIKIYAVQQLAYGRHQALLIDVQGTPKGMPWGVNTVFNLSHWLRDINF